VEGHRSLVPIATKHRLGKANVQNPGSRYSCLRDRLTTISAAFS